MSFQKKYSAHYESTDDPERHIAILIEKKKQEIRFTTMVTNQDILMHLMYNQSFKQ